MTEYRHELSAMRILRNLAMLLPALLVMVVTLSSSSCGSGGLLQPVNGSNSATPTSTATGGNAGGFAFVTNFNDGKVSSLTRNTTTGVLKHNGAILAGAKKGPRGLVISPSNSFLYVANVNDDNIYQFAVSATDGTLTALSPASVANGNGSGPDQLAMDSTGGFLWATGSGDGTVAAYTVNTSTGQLTKNGAALGGFNTPFGIAVNSANTILYVADAATGLIWPLAIASDGKISKSLPAAHSSDVNADTPGFIAIDSAGASLFVADQKLAEVSSFSIDPTTGALTAAFTFQNVSVNDSPIGIGIGTNTGIEFLFTANQGSAGLIGSISSFAANGTSLTVPATQATGYNGPVGLAVDPLNLFVYAADFGDGTVSVSVINGACGSAICAGSTFATESPANAASGPFGIVLSH